MLSLAIILFLLVVSFVLSQRKSNFKIFQAAVLVFLNILLIECICFAVLIWLIVKGNSIFIIGNQWTLDKLIKNQLIEKLYMKPSEVDAFYELHPDLGYTVGKSKIITNFLYLSNPQGIRSHKIYSQVPLPNKLRIALFGDSFVFCDGEANDRTWPYYLENLIGNLEVLNFGVSGYGLSASYLRYLHQGLAFAPDVIFFNYVDVGERDSVENVPLNGVRSFNMSTAYRNIFKIKNGILVNENVSPAKFFNVEFRKKYLYSAINQPRGIWAWSVFSVSNSGLLIKQFVFSKEYQNVKNFEQKSPQYAEQMVSNLLAVAKRMGTDVIFFCAGDFKNLPEGIRRIILLHREHVVYVDSNATMFEPLKNNVGDWKKVLNATNHLNRHGNEYYARVIADLLKSRSWGQSARKFKYDEFINSFYNVNSKN